VALAGLLPVRLLAERAGLTAGVSAAMHRPGYDPDYDRGQVLVDLALVQLAGGQAIGDFQALHHLDKLIGPVPSTPTVWRSLNEADALQVTRIHQAVCRFRRCWWGILAARPEGFPWLQVAGRELTGTTVIDLDASVVTVASDGKENSRPTYKGGVGFVPNLATCDNVDDVLVIDPRPGNATSNDADDNIATLTAAIAAIPGSYRRRVLVRLDGAGFSHKLPAPWGAVSYPPQSGERLEVDLGIRWLTLSRKAIPGTIACQETGGHAQAYGVARQGIRTISAKARLPEAQSPGGASGCPSERRLKPAPIPAAESGVIWGKPLGRGAMPSEGI
jgi:hypothetical protein